MFKPVDTADIVATAATDPPPGSGDAPRVVDTGFAVRGNWTLRFLSGDEDESSWVKIGDQPEFLFDAEESPGLVMRLDFGSSEGTVRFAVDRDGEGLQPVTLEPLGDGRYLVHLGDDDPPHVIEVTLLLEPSP